MSSEFTFFGGKGNSRSFKVISLNKKQILNSMPKGMNKQNRYYGKTPAAAASKAFTRYFKSPDTKFKIGQKVRVVIMEVTQGSKNKVFKYDVARIRNQNTRMLNGVEINMFKNRILTACSKSSSGSRSASKTTSKSVSKNSSKTAKSKKPTQTRKSK
tara:strand:- start:273 stop:743 length:471 start_codon:yes stop_codon:yes gene_type:complete